MTFLNAFVNTIDMTTLPMKDYRLPKDRRCGRGCILTWQMFNTKPNYGQVCQCNKHKLLNFKTAEKRPIKILSFNEHKLLSNNN